jgi:LacI family transcriptional regulator
MASDIDEARPTLKTIARLAGLAVPTVSRALNDAPDIGEETKRKVRRIAEEIGYRPNRAGLRLRTGKTNVIALILSTDYDMMNHTARLITAIAAATRNTPYHMIVTPYFPDEDPMTPVRYITGTRSADGVILNQTRPEDPRVEYLMQIGFPFATHGRTSWCDRHPYFDFDNAAYGRLSVRRLAARGRQRLALVAPPKSQNYAIEMRENAASEAARLGIGIHIFEDINSDMVAAEVERRLADYLTENPGIDGVISGSTNAATAIVAALEARGHEIGDDVDLVAKEAMPFLNRFRKGIVVVNEDVTRAGTFVAKALMQAIDHPELPPMQDMEVPE